MTDSRCLFPRHFASLQSPARIVTSPSFFPSKQEQKPSDAPSAFSETLNDATHEAAETIQ